jgi:hypothetical protein
MIVDHKLEKMWKGTVLIYTSTIMPEENQENTLAKSPEKK